MEEQKVFEMPPSWVAKIDISQIGEVLYRFPQLFNYFLINVLVMISLFIIIILDMEMRYPGGTKVVRYRKAKLEKFAPYFIKDGLVTRFTTYKDIECKNFYIFFMASSYIEIEVFQMCE